MPFVLSLGGTNPLARWMSVSVGLAAFLLTILTDHETGLFRVVPYRFHVAVDRLVGLSFVVLPLALGFSGLDLAYYLINAAAVLGVTLILNAAEPDPKLSLFPRAAAQAA